jgi:PleD family two-component response regulator
MNDSPQSNKVINTHILILDDSKAFLSGLKSILSEYNFTIFAHSSPLAALEDVKKNIPDIIICDLEMHELHGFEFIKKIREQENLVRIPILVLTGNTDTKAMSESIKLGADAFSTKETIRHTIIPQIYALLRLKSIHEEAGKLHGVKTLIGTYKHELGNNLAIIDGMIRILNRKIPSNLENPAMIRILKTIDKLSEILNKLNELRKYEEVKYSENKNILKIG